MPVTADLVLDVKDMTGEGPVWSMSDATLWWTDVNGRRLHRYVPASRTHDTFPMPARVGCFAMRTSGGIVCAMEHAIGFADPVTGRYEAAAAPEDGRTGNRFNDGRCDPRGRFFAGSMNEVAGGATGTLWRFDPDRAVTPIVAGISISNGLAWSPDGRSMYFADSPTRRIDAFDYDLDTGTPSNRRVFHATRDPSLGVPDGGAVDSEGCYWSARYFGGRVIRITPDGRIDREIRLPVGRVTMCAFGGGDLKTLYITSARFKASPEELAREPLAGGLFAIDAGVAGLPEPQFPG